MAKVAPDESTLAKAYSAFKRSAKAKVALQAELDRLNDEAIAAPKDLMEWVKATLTEHPGDNVGRSGQGDRRGGRLSNG